MGRKEVQKLFLYKSTYHILHKSYITCSSSFEEHLRVGKEGDQPSRLQRGASIPRKSIGLEALCGSPVEVGYPVRLVRSFYYLPHLCHYERHCELEGKSYEFLRCHIYDLWHHIYLNHIDMINTQVYVLYIF